MPEMVLPALGFGTNFRDAFHRGPRFELDDLTIGDVVYHGKSTIMHNHESISRWRMAREFAVGTSREKPAFCLRKPTIVHADRSRWLS